MILAWISLVTCHYSFCHHQSLKKSIKKASKRISIIVHALVQAKVAQCCMLQAKPSQVHMILAWIKPCQDATKASTTMKASNWAPTKLQREFPTLCRPSCRPNRPKLRNAASCKPSHPSHMILAWINLARCHKIFHHHQSLRKSSKKAPKRIFQHCAGHCAGPTCECCKCCMCCKLSHPIQVISAWINLVWCHKSFHHHESLQKGTKKASKRISNIVQAIVQAKMLQAKPY